MIESLISVYPDWPKPGVMFKDINPLLSNPQAMKEVAQRLYQLFEKEKINCIGAIEARGFVFGTAVAQLAELPLILFRKKGKLPGVCFQESYTLEYGDSIIELQKNALSTTSNILLIDDVIATGGTLLAAARLCYQAKACIVGAAALIGILQLPGIERLKKEGVLTQYLLSY